MLSPCQSVCVMLMAECGPEDTFCIAETHTEAALSTLPGVFMPVCGQICVSTITLEPAKR